jgi:hypothetical protein
MEMTDFFLAILAVATCAKAKLARPPVRRESGEVLPLEEKNTARFPFSSHYKKPAREREKAPLLFAEQVVLWRGRAKKGCAAPIVQRSGALMGRQRHGRRLS